MEQSNINNPSFQTESDAREFDSSSVNGNQGMDQYRSVLVGYEGTYSRDALAPTGFRDKDVSSIKYIVFKPDGDFFSKEYAKITSGTKKGERETRRNCILRYLLGLFPKAQIIDSGGTDASFHIVFTLDASVNHLFQNDREKFKETLEQLRLICFCDELGGSILGSQSARLIGSVNSKSKLTVREIQPSTGSYSIDDINELIGTWHKNPVVTLLRKWFGLGDDRTVRCPFHDSMDSDLNIDADDVEGGGAVCFGSNNCAKNGKAARISMVGGRGKGPSLAALILAQPNYSERWAKSYAKLSAQSVRAAGGGSKYPITITDWTKPDDILKYVQAAWANYANLYRDASDCLVSLERNPVTKVHEIRRYDSVPKFISLIDQIAQIGFPRKDFTEYGSMPYDRAAALFHRTDLREGLPILERVTSNPLVDPVGKRILPPGYNANTRTFYSGPEITPLADGKTPLLDKLLSGWTGRCGSSHQSCRGDRDVTHLYAAFFSEGLADSYLFTLHRHPVLRGNQKGCGKDKISECLGSIRDGTTPVDLHHEDENRFNQAFGNGIHDGRRIFQITNIKSDGPYANPMLTRFSTEENIRGAKHGGGNYVIHQNNVTFVLTLNEGTIDFDLLDRLLEINFEVEGKATTRKFDFDPFEYVCKFRHEIIVEILSLYLVCLNEDRKWTIPDGTDVRFRRWMEVLGPMLESKGLRDFMNDDTGEQNDVDEDYQSFVELLTRLYAKKGCEKARAKEIVQICQGGDSGIFTSRTSGKNPESHFSKYVLMRLVGQKISIPQGEENTIQVALRRQTDPKNKSGQYWIEILGGVTPENGGGKNVTPLKEGGANESNGGVSGVKASKGGVDIYSPPATQIPTIQDITQSGGVSGVNSLGGAKNINLEALKSPKNESIIDSMGSPLGTAPADPAHPAAPQQPATNDPWAGGVL